MNGIGLVALAGLVGLGVWTFSKKSAAAAGAPSRGVPLTPPPGTPSTPEWDAGFALWQRFVIDKERCYDDNRDPYPDYQKLVNFLDSLEGTTFAEKEWLNDRKTELRNACEAHITNIAPGVTSPGFVPPSATYPTREGVTPPTLPGIVPEYLRKQYWDCYVSQTCSAYDVARISGELQGLPGHLYGMTRVTQDDIDALTHAIAELGRRYGMFGTTGHFRTRRLRYKRMRTRGACCAACARGEPCEGVGCAR
jgi:hypothetical protein